MRVEFSSEGKAKLQKAIRSASRKLACGNEDLQNQLYKYGFHKVLKAADEANVNGKVPDSFYATQMKRFEGVQNILLKYTLHDKPMANDTVGWKEFYFKEALKFQEEIWDMLIKLELYHAKDSFALTVDMEQLKAKFKNVDFGDGGCYRGQRCVEMMRVLKYTMSRLENDLENKPKIKDIIELDRRILHAGNDLHSPAAPNLKDYEGWVRPSWEPISVLEPIESKEELRCVELIEDIPEIPMFFRQDATGGHWDTKQRSPTDSSTSSNESIVVEPRYVTPMPGVNMPAEDPDIAAIDEMHQAIDKSDVSSLKTVTPMPGVTIRVPDADDVDVQELQREMDVLSVSPGPLSLEEIEMMSDVDQLVRDYEGVKNTQWAVPVGQHAYFHKYFNRNLKFGERDHSHPCSALQRKLQEDMVYKEIRKSTNGVIIDVGGNMLRHKSLKRKRIHCCNPKLLSAGPQDFIRAADVELTIKRLGMSDTLTRCFHLAQQCDCVVGAMAMFIHSIYYIDLEDILKIVHGTALKMAYSVHHSFVGSGGYYFPRTKRDDDSDKVEPTRSVQAEGVWYAVGDEVSVQFVGNATYRHRNVTNYLRDGYFTKGGLAMAWSVWRTTPYGDIWKFVVADVVECKVPQVVEVEKYAEVDRRPLGIAYMLKKPVEPIWRKYNLRKIETAVKAGMIAYHSGKEYVALLPGNLVDACVHNFGMRPVYDDSGRPLRNLHLQVYQIYTSNVRRYNLCQRFVTSLGPMIVQAVLRENLKTNYDVYQDLLFADLSQYNHSFMGRWASFVSTLAGIISPAVAETVKKIVQISTVLPMDLNFRQLPFGRPLLTKEAIIYSMESDLFKLDVCQECNDDMVVPCIADDVELHFPELMICQMGRGVRCLGPYVESVDGQVIGPIDPRIDCPMQQALGCMHRLLFYDARDQDEVYANWTSPAMRMVMQKLWSNVNYDVEPQDFADWVKKYPLSKRNALLECRLKVMGNPDSVNSIIKFFVKDEHYFKKNFKPRIIQGRDSTYMAAWGPEAEAISEEIMRSVKVEEGFRPRILFTSKMTSLEIGEQVARIVGDYMTKKGIVCDAKTSDGSMRACKQIGLDFMRKFRCVVDSLLATNAINKQQHAMMVSYCNVMAKFEWRMSSGEFVTYSMNCFIHGSAVTFSLDASMPACNLVPLVSGDDVNALMPYWSDIEPTETGLQKMQEHYWSLGFDIEPKICNVIDMTFCSSHFYEVEIEGRVTLTLGPKIGRMLWKMFWRRSKLEANDDRDWLSAVLLGRYFDFQPVPILGPMIRELNLKWQPEVFAKFIASKPTMDSLAEVLHETKHVKHHMLVASRPTTRCYEIVAGWYNCTVADLMQCEFYVRTECLRSQPFTPVRLTHWLLDVILQVDVGSYDQL